ncbi:phage tail protein [Desulfoluna butyratoxydans]|uniref:Phage tail collar domain n=1 Tax=Desulfoluna butyratoxydans TaxID=231438 RepID=A0A4U8YRZ0_9BACT|nr:tail fiber protein [Desulfoluna butyratoxydans]VFQ46099.1 phage tail collar domain [Desulfoluna butyratoxydans]
MDPYIGEIRLFGGNFAPRNWFLCDGRLLAVSQYVSLFSIIGNAYGGDGVSNFALPDLRGRTPVGLGQGPGLSIYWTMGMSAGQEAVTLNQATMPSHGHSTQNSISVALKATRLKGQDTAPDNGSFLAAGDNVETSPAHSIENYISPPGQDKQVALKGAAINSQVVASDTGGSTAHQNMQPWVATTYIICWDGIYPPRS